MFCWYSDDFSTFASNIHLVHDLKSIYDVCENLLDDAQYDCLSVCCLEKEKCND